MTIDIQALADALQGTCDSLEAHLPDEVSGLSTQEAAELDQLIFCCEVCSWWCEISEMSQIVDMVCDDCGGDDDWDDE